MNDAMTMIFILVTYKDIVIIMKKKKKTTKQKKTTVHNRQHDDVNNQTLCLHYQFGLGHFC